MRTLIVDVKDPSDVLDWKSFLSVFHCSSLLGENNLHVPFCLRVNIIVCMYVHCIVCCNN